MGTWEKRMAEKANKVPDPGPMPTEEPPCCAEWRVDGNHGWRLFLKCEFHREGCDCEHHKDEVWLA